ncbi:MAG: 30S ribosomal protein S24e [Candidatus Odinarchaeota archaeon]
MEIDILNEFNNPLVGRREYSANIAHEGAATPKRTELRKALAARVNSDVEKTVLIEIETHFGLAHSIVRFHVYDDPEQLKRIENKYVLKRNTITE